MIKKIMFFVLLMLSFVLPVSANQNDTEEFKDLSIIVPSYDKYSELWSPFFTTLFKHWLNISIYQSI